MSCADNGESVFLYFIDAYAGAETVSIIGDTGPLVQGAKFGERHGVDGTCRPGGNPRRCVPIEYDRTIGGEFQMVVDRMAEVAETGFNLQNMYPQETATIVFNKRIGETSVDTRLFRHIQSASSTCTLTMVNSLSLDNSDLAAPNQFSMIPEFRIDDPNDAGYLDEGSLDIPTECGNLPADEGLFDQIARLDIQDRVRESPWFTLIECTDDTDPSVELCFAWGPPLSDDRSFINLDGDVLSERTTFEFWDCLQGAFTFNTEGMMGAAPGEDSCPPAPLTWDDVSVDPQAVLECQLPRFVSPRNVEPSASYSIVQAGGNCEYTMRPRTAAQDVIFEGRHGVDNGDLIVSEIEIDGGSEHFWVLFGRPVNPLLWEWDSGNQIADLRDFPYFNGQDSRIGDY